MDDLRQDAVMQHKQSSQIRKRIRSYKVAPLTPTVAHRAVVSRACTWMSAFWMSNDCSHFSCICSSDSARA